MLLAIIKLLDLVNALLDHFVDTTGTVFWMNTDYEWQANIVSHITPKGNQTVAALATVIHMGTIFLAQLMLLLAYPFHNITVYYGPP